MITDTRGAPRDRWLHGFVVSVGFCRPEHFQLLFDESTLGFEPLATGTGYHAQHWVCSASKGCTSNL